MCPFHQKVVPLRPATPVASVQGTLALDLVPRHDPPEPSRVDCRAGADVVPIDRRLRSRLEQWSLRYAQAAAEIAGGDRPVSQLLRWSTPRVYEDLARRAQLVARSATRRVGAGRVQPIRPQVIGVHTSFVAPDVAEVSAHLRYGQRSRALAMRFERRDDRWLCAALEFA